MSTTLTLVLGVLAVLKTGVRSSVILRHGPNETEGAGLPPQTNLTEPQSGSRLVGGTNTFSGEFPWMALVVTQDCAGFLPCGGSLIHASWVLTAASCLVGTKVSVNVHLGMQTRLHWDGSVTIGASSWFVHPQYNPANNNNDVGLVKLKTPANMTAYIGLVRLPRSSDGNVNYAGSEGTALGWGSNVLGGVPGSLDASLSWDLQKVLLPIISTSACLAASTYPAGTVSSATLCTSGAGGKSTCTYDMGGPLMVRESDGLWTQIGVASFVSSKGCTAEPAGFSRVTSHLGWIGATANITIRT